MAAKPNYPCTRFGGQGYLTCPTSASLQTLGAAGSFLCRFKTRQALSGQYLFRAQRQAGFYIGSTGKFSAVVAGISGAVPNLVLALDTWYDALVTWAVPGNVVAYVCPVGGSDTTATQAAVGASPFNQTCTAGAYAAGVSVLNGSLRDVMLLSRVITPTEWAAYKAGVKPTGSVVADWSLYPNWNDASGNANNLTAGGVSPTFNPRAAARQIANYPCTRFGGQGYLTCPTSASLQTLGAAGSFLCRFETNEVGRAQTIFRSVGRAYLVFASTNFLAVNIAGAAVASPIVKLSANTWYDVLFTWAYPGNMVIKVCPTGGSDTTSAEYATASGGSWTGINYIGSYAGASLWLNGSMRDVMLLSRVITAGEWTAYKAGTKPTGSVVADWPLYPDWLDDSGNANTLTAGGVAPTFNPRAAT